MYHQFMIIPCNTQFLATSNSTCTLLSHPTRTQTIIILLRSKFAMPKCHCSAYAGESGLKSPVGVVIRTQCSAQLQVIIEMIRS